MNNKRSRIVDALIAVGVVSISQLALTGQVVAQQTAPAVEKIEKIEITGSSIKRIEGESALPVTVITKADIEKSGATTPSELLQLISSNNSLGAVQLANSVGTTTFSAQTASLRGLGGGRTLVLINGKRASGFAGEVNGVQGVNLAVIPFTAIERVEVLKDGASAVYGSDAIGGVINFILRSDYQGVEATAYYGAPTRSGGGAQEKYSAAAGFGNLGKDRYNVLMTLSYNEQKPLDQASRSFSNTSYLPNLGVVSTSSNTFPGNITTGGIGPITMTTPGVGVIAAPNNCAPSAFLGGVCRYDPSSVPGVESIPHDKLGNFFASGRMQFNADWQGYLTAVASKDETRLVIQPVPISNIFTYGPNGDIPATVTLLPTSPFYPTALAAAAGVGGQPLNIRYRAVENGFRDTTDTNQATQFSGGVKGVVGTWDLDTSFYSSTAHTTQHVNSGFPLYSKLLPLLNGGTVNLFGPNSAAVTAQMKATNFVGDALKSTSKSSGLQVRAGSDIWQLPAGMMAMAFGGEMRHESLNQTYDPTLKTGDVSGFGGSFPDLGGKRDIRAYFAELNVPILKSLEGNVAFRSDHYSDFGNTTNPKVSLRWEPMKSLLLRTSYGKGFLAPSLFQLFIPQANTVTAAGTSDPIRCPVTHDTGSDCNTQFNVTTGGNPNLKPEKSEQATFGVVLEPGWGLTFSADYFKIRLNNQITTGIPVPTILGDLKTYGNLVTRAAPAAPFPNLPGRITSIQGTNINLGALHVEGIDFETHWRGPNWELGQLRFDLAGTYYRRNDAQNPDGSYTGFVSNQAGAVISGVVPRWKHYATVSWSQGPWATTLGNTFQSDYIDVNTDGNGDPRRVSAMSLFDLQLAYSGIKNMTFTLGAKNILDTNPPRTNQNTLFIVGVDPTYYDVRARFIYGSVRYEFK